MAEKGTEEKKDGMEKLSFRGMVRQATVYLFVIALSIIFIFILFKWSELHKAFNGLLKILAPVIAGLVIAYVLLPVVEFVERRLLKLDWVVKSKNPSRTKRVVPGSFRGMRYGFCFGDHIYPRIYGPASIGVQYCPDHYAFSDLYAAGDGMV